jgi:hypothetical protein
VTIPHDDHERAAREDRARQRLIDAGASSLPRAPWLHHSQPPSSIDLVRFAVWRGQTGEVTEEEVDAALNLLPAARAEVEQLETALLFTARAEGMSWGRISRGMGLGSAQAALQRYERLSDRVSSRAES